MKQEYRKSAAIATRIAETKARLHEVETALAALPGEKDRALSGEKIDHEALNVMDEREAQLTRECAHLQKRLPLLTQQQEEAERDEARARLAELPGVVKGLREEAFAHYLTLTQLEAKFGNEFTALAQLYAQERELRAEERFLSVRYHLPRVHKAMPHLDDPREQFAALRNLILYELQRAAQGDGTQTIWDQQLRAWEDAGRPSALPKPQAVPLPPLPPPQIFPVTGEGRQQATVTLRAIDREGEFHEILYEPPGRGYPQRWTFSDLRGCTIRGDLPAWVEQVPVLKAFVDGVEAEKSKAA